MSSSVSPAEWKPMDSAGNRMVTQGEMPWMAPVAPMQLLPADVVARCTFSGALNECVRCDGRQDNEICRDMHISPGYFSKFLRSVGEAWAKRMVLFMRTTRCLAPLQVLAHELGCELVLRDSRAAEVAALKARLMEIERGGRVAA